MNNQFKLFWHKIYISSRHKRDAWLKPISCFLIKLKVTPNHVTGFRLILAFLMPVLLGWNYWLVVLLMVLNLVLDGVDGAIARIQDTSSKKGKAYDLIVDTSTLVFFVLGLIFWNLADGFLAAFYAINYLVVIFFNLQYQDLKKDGVLMSKSRYFVLIAFLLLAVFGINWLDYVFVFSGIYLFVYNFFLIHFYLNDL